MVVEKCEKGILALEIELTTADDELKGKSKEEMEAWFTVLLNKHHDTLEIMTNVLFAIPDSQQDHINQLSKQFISGFHAKKESIIPKKKFGFKNRGKNVGKKNKEETTVGVVDQTIDEKALYIKDLKDCERIVDEAELTSKETIVVENCANIRLTVPFTLKNGFIKNVQNSTILIHVV